MYLPGRCCDLPVVGGPWCAGRCGVLTAGTAPTGRGCTPVSTPPRRASSSPCAGGQPGGRRVLFKQTAIPKYSHMCVCLCVRVCVCVCGACVFVCVRVYACVHV